MGAANLPQNIQNNDPLDAGAVMQNFQAITQVVNGNLEADTNVSAAAAATQPGNTNSEGVAATMARSDHQHIIQGFENLAVDPTTGNFKGRVYWNTSSTEFRYCTDAAGSGTYGTFTPAATELVVHAAQHKDGGHDPLADNTLTDHMFAAKGTIYSATLGTTHTSISSSAFSTIVDLTGVTTAGSQTLGIWVTLIFRAGANSATHNGAFRVVDVTASNTTIYLSTQAELHTSGVQTQISGFFYYTTPSSAARTLRVQAGVNSGNDCDVVAETGTFNTETLNTPTIVATVL